MVRFIARGIIGDNGDNAALIGRFTFLSKAGRDWYQWNAAHRATHFDTLGEALTAAASCKGPWFNLPVSGTIEAVGVSSVTVLDPSGLARNASNTKTFQAADA